MTEAPDELVLNFSGRIIDHLGIQMYQSPIAAIAEMVSNSWDADANKVDIILPERLSVDSVIVIKDDGNGMTINECQNRYLTTGFDTRKGNPNAKSKGGRFLMGRKGIGKFAGFGISKKITIETISKETGEQTKFTMDLDKIRSDEYIGKPIRLDDFEYSAPDPDRKSLSGTKVTLQVLNLSKAPSATVFLRGMSRRFMINQNLDEFNVKVNDISIPEEDGVAKAEFVFPRDYEEDDKAKIKMLENGAGEEVLADGNIIKWRIAFYPDIIAEDDLKGVSVFAHKKIAQNPFIFNLTAHDLPSNTGPEYMTGKVEADFIDQLPSDVISTERQRVNWDHPGTQILLRWGQSTVKKLLKIRKKKRNEKLEDIMMNKLSPFALRIDKLEPHEKKIVLSALKKLATINKINPGEFEDIGNAILTAWEGGRLKGLINRLSQVDEIDDTEFLGILLETKVLTALHTAEAVKTKLDIIKGFETRISKRDRENSIRDFIAENPWLISSKWDTFRKEIRVTNLLKEAAKEANLDDVQEFKGRLDLVLSSGQQLLILELMRPGITLDDDHIFRFEKYIRIIRGKLNANSVLEFSSNQTTGFLIADGLDGKSYVLDKINSLKDENMFCVDWQTLLAESMHNWRDFLSILQERVPSDERLRNMV